MDQLKTFIRQCILYRFWIAVGVSMLLPIIGYFVGSSAYTTATTKREGEIKKSLTDVSKFDGTPPNADYKKLVDEKKEVLTNDVTATQRKLYDRQEPLLQWPEVVEGKFRSWGRKWPENTDLGQVQAVIRDYTVAYPEFVTKVYQTFKPWNPEDGTGIVFAPDQTALIRPATFTIEAPPDLGKVWAEQERLWVLTALFDVIAKVNKDAGAKDWDSAWIKQIVDIDVGSSQAQDQQSIAKGVALEPAPTLTPDGAPAPEPVAAPSGMPGMEGMMGRGGPGSNSGEVFYLKPEGGGPYKILPVEITVMIDQNRLAEFMVALENSPMAIQVMEPEISKPSAPIVKPVYGESNFAMGGMMGGMMGEGGMMSGNYGRSQQGRMSGAGMGGMGESMGGMMSGMGMRGMSGMMGGSAAPKKTGESLRGKNKAAERKQAAEAANKVKAAPKKGVDQYFNVIQLTIYGQARFYDTPPAVIPPESSSSTGTEPAPAAAEAAATPEPAAVTPPPAGEPAKTEAVPAQAGGGTATPAPAPAPAPAPGTEPTSPASPAAPAPKS